MSTLIERHGTLYNAALALPRVAELHGRGPAPVVALAGDVCVVRHYRRGGAIASALGDRYARFGGNRFVHELRTSEAARSRGVATPRVSCGARYRHGPFQRFDIATVFVPGAHDLGFVLFGDAAPPPTVINFTGQLIRSMLHAGLYHRDLNVKNILVTSDRAYVLDLDRCTMVDQLAGAEVRAMRDRFFRSIEKWEQKTGRPVAAVAKQELREAFDG